MSKNILENDYERLSDIRKSVWCHYRKMAILVSQFTELLIVELTHLLTDLQPVFLECELDKSRYLEYKKALKNLSKQMTSFEKKVDYNVFEEIDLSSINSLEVLSRAGQVCGAFGSFASVMEIIGANNPELEGMITSSFSSANALVENVHIYTRVCKLDASLYANDDEKMNYYINKKYLFFDSDYRVDESGIGIARLPKSVRKEVEDFQSTDIDDSYDKDKAKVQSTDIVKLCHEFIKNSAPLCAASIMDFIGTFREIILDCDIDSETFKQYLDVERSLSIKTRELEMPGDIERDVIDEWYKILFQYKKVTSIIAVNNPVLLPFRKTGFDMTSSLMDRIYLAYNMVSGILRECEVQAMVYDFNKDFSEVLISDEQKMEILEEAYRIIEDGGDLSKELAGFEEDLGPVLAFDSKWGNEAFYLGVPVGGTYFVDKSIKPDIFEFEYKKYYDKCGEGGNYGSEGRLHFKIGKAMEHNDWGNPSYSPAHLKKVIGR